MSSTTYNPKEIDTKIDVFYEFKEVGDNRWGIYLHDRLLATVGSYEACESMKQLLNRNLSRTDILKAEIAFKKAINKSLIVS